MKTPTAIASAIAFASSLYDIAFRLNLILPLDGEPCDHAFKAAYALLLAVLDYDHDHAESVHEDIIGSGEFSPDTIRHYIGRHARKAGQMKTSTDTTAISGSILLG